MTSLTPAPSPARIATEQHEVPDAPLSPSDAQPKPVPPAAPPRQEASERARFHDGVVEAERAGVTRKGGAEQAECPGSAGALEYGGDAPTPETDAHLIEQVRNTSVFMASPYFTRNLERERDAAIANLALSEFALDDLNHTFALRRDADMRAIDRWRKAHPGNDPVVPDHADLVVWLMEQLGRHDAPQQEPVCHWKQDDDGNWDTGCGHTFVFENGTPSENRQRFCGYCGGKLIEQP